MCFTIYYITWKPICTNYKRQLDDKNSPSGSARGRWVEWVRGEPKISEFSQSATFSPPSKTHSNPLLPACQPACLVPEMKYSWQPWIFICCLSSYQHPALLLWLWSLLQRHPLQVHSEELLHLFNGYLQLQLQPSDSSSHPHRKTRHGAKW